jgi:hypothetical protein
MHTFPPLSLIDGIAKDCISVGECKFKFSNAVRTSEDKSSKDAINCSSLSSADEVDDAAADVAGLRTLP